MIIDIIQTDTARAEVGLTGDALIDCPFVHLSLTGNEYEVRVSFGADDTDLDRLISALTAAKSCAMATTRHRDKFKEGRDDYY